MKISEVLTEAPRKHAAQAAINARKAREQGNTENDW